MENGSNHQISTKRMVERLVAVVAVRPKYVVYAMGSGMGQRTARRTKKRIGCSMRQKKLDGNDAIVVGQWLN